MFERIKKLFSRMLTTVTTSHRTTGMIAMPAYLFRSGEGLPITARQSP